MMTIKLKCECSYTTAGCILDSVATKLTTLGDSRLSTRVDVGIDLYDVELIGHKSYVEVIIKPFRTFDSIYESVYLGAGTQC